MVGERAEDRGALNRRVLKMLKEMQATPDTATIKGLEVLLDRVFHRIYAGIEVDMQGLARLRELSKEGSLVLLPSHKSHVDYLVLSFIFNQHNLQMPMIAAGDNLSFFPLGPILRRAGGFFIRRSFRGDKLYSVVVEAYVRRLLRDGYTLELFLEGGRSRTGKLLEPKFGMLAMMVDAALSLPNREVFFVPISIGYERIIETSGYSAGADRRRKAARKTRPDCSRRPRCCATATAASTCSSATRSRSARSARSCASAAVTRPDRRASAAPWSRASANRAMDEINHITAVTPGALTALALLSDRRRSITHEELVERCQKLVAPAGRVRRAHHAADRESAAMLRAELGARGRADVPRSRAGRVVPPGRLGRAGRAPRAALRRRPRLPHPRAQAARARHVEEPHRALLRRARAGRAVAARIGRDRR